jgi:hypothetical protein
MNIEHSLAAKTISRAIANGYQRFAAISQACTMLRSQGFSLSYSRQIAEEMYELIA